jgi:cytochrome c553
MRKVIVSMLFASITLLMADGATAYKKCAACHGVKGEKKALGKSAIIGGRDATKTVEQLKGYKAGTLNQYGMGGVMKGQVATLDEAGIKELADYIATLKK